MLTYNITWRSASCNRASIIQYQIQVARGCTTGSTQTQTLTGNNETTALLVILSCEMNCYLRIRAEMSGSSYTDYSACIIINDQLMQNESMWHNHSTSFSKYDVCHVIMLMQEKFRNTMRQLVFQSVVYVATGSVHLTFLSMVI